jgi:hypothetical protein
LRPGPSHAGSVPSPTTASAGVPSSSLKCRAARFAESAFSPSRSGGAANDLPDTGLAAEQAAIDAGQIRAGGLRYVGRVRPVLGQSAER